MLNLKALLTQILNILTLKSGVTMTGEVQTSTGAVAMGSGQIGTENGLTIAEFVNQVRYSSGAMGSVKINSSTAGGYTFSGWYNYIYIPHRSGGLNGAARTSGGTDNHNYGNVMLCHMTTGGQFYNIRVTGGTIAQVYKFETNASQSVSRGNTLTSVATTYYSLETSASRTNYSYSGRVVSVTLGVTAKSPVKWSAVFASGLPVPMQNPVYGCLGCDTDNSAMAISINSSGQISGSGGVANKLYYGTIYYVTAL